MSKLDDCIANLNYITESLVVLRDIYNSGDCNSCIDKNNCMYCPEPGQLVRYNCPFYHGKEVNKKMTYDELIKSFKNTFPSAEIEDYRPVCHEFFEKGKIGITIWLKNGDMVVYYPKESEDKE